MTFATRLVGPLVLALLGSCLPTAATTPTLPAGKPIRLRTGSFDPLAAPTAQTQSTSTTPLPSPGLVLVQFTGPFDAAWRDPLAAQGIRLLRPVPVDAFVARWTGGALAAAQALPFVRWIGPYEPRFRLHPRVSSERPGRLSILFTADAAGPDQWAIARSFQNIQRVARTRFGTVLQGTLPTHRLETLLRSPWVLWVEPAPRMRLVDEIASKIVGGDDGAAGTPTLTQQLGFDGSGVTVAVADSGLDIGEADGIHPDFAGRVDGFFAYGGLPDASDEHSHGTHVAGIVLGNGATGEVDDNGYLYGLGVAPGAHVVAQRLFDGLGDYYAPSSYEELTRDAVRSGAAIGSNSWGDDAQGDYDLSAAEFDALVRDADALTPGDQAYILEFSAGNSGPGAQTINSPAVAKNVIATGACENNRPEFPIYADGQDVVADFSSRGPSADGRIKPDLTAPGTWIASAKSQFAGDENAWSPISGYYMYQGGTSQAGPHASGAAAVFFQFYRQTHAGQRPSPALTKAALINTAIDLGASIRFDDEFGDEIVGNTGPVPNHDEGWGLIDLTELIGGAHEFRFVDQNRLLRTGDVHEERVLVNPYDRLKVTLAYTDPPGFPGALPALVNDLDLEVVGPDGRLYRGNAFFAGESIPDTEVGDSLNNVEGVLLTEPSPGEYVIRVRARQVVEDIRQPPNPVPEQDFALVLSGDLAAPGEGLAYFDQAVYRVPATPILRFVDPDLAGQSGVQVRVTTTTEADGESLVLQPDGAGGAFTNRVGLSSAPTATGDGLLEARHGDQLQMYLGSQTTPEALLAAVPIDLLPPALTSVQAVSQFGRTTIVWETDEPADSRLAYGTAGSLTSQTNSPGLVRTHQLALPPLTAGQTYQFYVVSADAAGNLATNNNQGSLYSFVGATAATALLVYAPDQLVDLPGIDTYTATLDQLGVSYEVWDLTVQPAPTASDLKPFRTVLWRAQELEVGNVSLTAAMQAALRRYLADGGSLFMASMEVLTRLTLPADLDFRRQILHVDDFVTDAGAEFVTGTAGDPVGGGLELTLDYSQFPDLFGFIVWPDLPDHLSVSPEAVPILTDPFSGGILGLRYPRTGLDATGRVVFCSVALESFPVDTPPQDRATFLGRALDFLVPGVRNFTSAAFDRPAYTVPAFATVEIIDTARAGAGPLTVTLDAPLESTPQTLAVAESLTRGIFRGNLLLAPTNAVPAPGQLRVQHDDVIRVQYAEPGGRVSFGSATVDLVAPAIADVTSEPAYNETVVRWTTDTPADSLVRFGETPGDDSFLTRTAYSPARTLDHEVVLNGLLPDRIYYFYVTSRDPAGNATSDTRGGALHQFRTLRPLGPPWTDTLEAGVAGWIVLSDDSAVDEESGLSLLNSFWQWGSPDAATSVEPHSGTRCWGTNLRGDYVDAAISDLVSPAIDLTGGNRATLRFWQFYDFQARSELLDIEAGQVAVSTDDGANWTVVYGTSEEFLDGWEEVELDISRFAGRVIRIDWNYQMFSFDPFPRPGWFIDDLSITLAAATPTHVTISNNLAQAAFAINGPLAVSANASGLTWTLTNAPAGTYEVVWSPVPYHLTPPPQTNMLATNGTLTFLGTYLLVDTNANDLADSWEQEHFGAAAPHHPGSTDTDDDGASDLDEFRAGTDPANPGSNLELAAPLTQFNDTVRLEWPSALGRDYVLEVSNDLLAWTPLGRAQRGDGRVLGLTLPPLDPRLPYYFRIRVTP